MNTQQALSALGYFIRNVLLVDVGLLLLTLLVCWLIGWRSPNDYGQILMFAGALTAAAGVFSFSGISWLSANPNYRLLSPTSPEWLKPYSETGASGNAPVLVMLVAGLIGTFGGLALMILSPYFG